MKKNVIKKVKPKKNRFLIWAIVVVVIIAAVWYYFDSFSGIGDIDIEMDSSVRSAVQNRSLLKTKTTVLSKLKLLEQGGKYGDWPLSDVSLSDDRGNPFLRKR